MNISSAEGISGPGQIQPVPGAGRQVPSRPVAPKGDRVEVSDIARFRQALAKVPEIRLEKVQAIREAIERGDYETEEKLEIAVERLLKELED